MDTVQGIFSLGRSMAQAPTELQTELDKLEDKLPSARLLISRSEWGMFKKKELDELILKLKYATYDAEDLLRDFQDQALRQQIEDAGRSRAGQLISSSVNRATHLLYGSNQRVRETQDKLDSAMAMVEKELNLMGLHVEPVKVMPTTTAIITASQVFGRDAERDQVMEMLGVTATIDRMDKVNQVITQMSMPSQHNSAKRHKGNCSSSSAPLAETTHFTGDVSVLPIFGIGGMGKTTLAQLIYNDERVKACFNMRIWVCVSDLFDSERMTQEIVNTISSRNLDLSCGLGFIQAELKEHLRSQRFLLVLDDIWQITQQQWEPFYAPFRHGLEGSMILVTTRHENIARLVATSNCYPVQLEGLSADMFWEFFKKCAFGKQCPESYPHLQEIGRSISSKLCGNPLAAKTLGHLLNSNMTQQHWMAINDSELWQQVQKEGDILPALGLSYLYLPTELRRCFAFCSIFPKDYSFKRREIIDIWVAQGFVTPQRNMCLADVGASYLDELRDRCLLQIDSTFPDKNRYVMHDLIHDTAKYVSMHECFSMKDSSGMRIHEPRHLSVEVDCKSLSTMPNIQHLNKLRSLRFATELHVEITWFSKLSNILFLSLKGCKLDKLPESICELNSLRYLDISFNPIKELPAKFWGLYNLQVVDATASRLEKIHQGVTKLINLRRLALQEKASISLSKVRALGNLSCLQKLRYFTVGRHEGAIGELKGMNQLRGTLRIQSIYNVKSKEEAAEARLVDKKYLKELDLNWRTTPTTCEPRPRENEVFDGLCPNERIECLKVHGFAGDRLPSWFSPKGLETLRSLKISRCPYLETLSIPQYAGVTQDGSTDQNARSSANCNTGIASHAFTHLTAISIVGCNGLKNLDQFLCPNNLPSVQSISIDFCSYLESIPADSFVGFAHLQDLKLRSCCRRLVCPQAQKMVLPPSLRRLFIWPGGELDRSFPSCLEKVTSLTVLCLISCANIKSIPLDLIPCRNTLKFLILAFCDELSSIGGSGVPPSIEFACVYGCPKLTQLQQPFRKNGEATYEWKEATKFLEQPGSWFWDP